MIGVGGGGVCLGEGSARAVLLVSCTCAGSAVLMAREGQGRAGEDRGPQGRAGQARDSVSGRGRPGEAGGETRAGEARGRSTCTWWCALVATGSEGGAHAPCPCTPPPCPAPNPPLPALPPPLLPSYKGYCIKGTA